MTSEEALKSANLLMMEEKSLNIFNTKKIWDFTLAISDVKRERREGGEREERGRREGGEREEREKRKRK